VVAFAGACDWLQFEPDRPLMLEVEGPTAPAAGPADDNLVLRAARALSERAPGLRLGRFRLIKTLPVAAGLGGGSSDAAAALRALAHENGIASDDPRVWEAARATGADVSVCLEPRARTMAGIGDRIGPALGIAPLPAVLVNPRVAVPTPQVFVGLGLARGEASDYGPAPDPGLHGGDFVGALRQGRNDLQASAEAIAPAISDALAALAAGAGVRLARMSGSGATCFALYEDRHAAARAARALKRARPDWWVRATCLR
jgi:4-diphosphocytidyl-2-C-methyl-D-erythritol kinase